MPRIRIDDLNKYGSSSSNGSYFKLKDDKDTASVRFMINDAEDLNNYIYVVHNEKVPGAEFGRDVNCLREYNDPVDVCPLCAAGHKLSTKLYLPLYDEGDETVKIWSRSRTFIQKMTSLCTRYKDLVSHVFDVERNGKPRDQKTTYEIYETDSDDTTLEDLPEVPEILGRYIMDKTADDMEYFLEAGEFPPDDDEDVPARRRSFRDDDEDDEEEEERSRRRPERERTVRRNEGRRTPAKGRDRQRKEDKF